MKWIRPSHSKKGQFKFIVNVFSTKLFIDDSTFMSPTEDGRDLEGVLPYMAYTEMCRWTGYGFCPICPEQGL